MHAESIMINVRQSTGTYIAKAKGYKPSASCSAGPRQAAVALATKLGLSSDLLQEQRCDGLEYGRSRFLARTAPFQPEPDQPESGDAETANDDDWHMNPCKQGHSDVGAAGGVAHCYQCDEKIVASTTQEAFERWNATHSKGQSRLSTTSN